MLPNRTKKPVDQLAQQFKLRSSGTVAVESFFIFFIGLLAFLGNLMVLIAVTKNARLRRKVPNVYIITLAVSDFLMPITGISFTFISVMLGKWSFNSIVCQFQGFCILLMCAVSLQSLALTAVNRYYRIARSQAEYQKIFTLKSTKIMISILWIIAIFAPLPYVVANQEFFFHPGKVFCTHNLESLLKGYGAFLVLFYVTVPLVVIVICYSKVFITIRHHNSVSVSRLRENSASSARLSVEEIDLTYTLFFVVLGFLVCWTPVLIIDMIDFVNKDWLLPRAAYFAYTCCGFGSTAVNPIIYGIRNRSFRKEYYNILTCGAQRSDNR